MFLVCSYLYFYSTKPYTVQNKFTFLILLTLFLISNRLKSQNTCFYVEDKPISRGYICLQDTLHFTNTVETRLKGEISANQVIIIKPSPLHDIIIKVNDADCQDCLEGEGTTTIRTKDRTGGGKGSKMQNPDTLSQYNISLKKNPAKNILEIYNPNNIAITQSSIYDSFGRRILR